MTAVWRCLALVLLETDARYGRFPGRHCRRTMSRAEVMAITAVLDALPAAVDTWSEGNARWDPFVVRVIDEPLRTLSDSGGGRFWPAPQDVSDALAANVSRGEFDSVFVIWPSDGKVPLCGWGCSIGPTHEVGGAGYSAIIDDHWQGYAAREFPEEGFIHEWLHQVESVYRALGVGENRLPGLHDVDGRTSARGLDLPPFGDGYVGWHARTDTWQPWYRDLMTGTVGLKPGERPPLGLTPSRWARRGR